MEMGSGLDEHSYMNADFDSPRDRLNSLAPMEAEEELLYRRRLSTSGALEVSALVNEWSGSAIKEELDEAKNSLESKMETESKRPRRKSSEVGQRKRTAAAALDDDSGGYKSGSSPKKSRQAKGRISHVFKLGGEEFEVKTSGSRGVMPPNKWTEEEDDALANAVMNHGEKNWKIIADLVPGRNHVQCLQRWKKVLRPGLKKGHWTPEEDAKLHHLVMSGVKHWGQVAGQIPGRVAKQCRERWANHLDPDIKKGKWEAAEDTIILEMHLQLGNKWAAISKMLPGRTENAVKIRWKSLSRRNKGAKGLDGVSVPSSTSNSPAMRLAGHAKVSASVEESSDADDDDAVDEVVPSYSPSRRTMATLTQPVSPGPGLPGLAGQAVMGVLSESRMPSGSVDFGSLFAERPAGAELGSLPAVAYRPPAHSLDFSMFPSTGRPPAFSSLDPYVDELENNNMELGDALGSIFNESEGGAAGRDIFNLRRASGPTESR